MNPIGPRGVYDEAKRFAEAMTMAYHRSHGVDTRIVRIFNTYGPRMRPHDGRVVSNFIVQALRGEPLTIYGDGAQTRQLLLRRRRGRGDLPAVHAAATREPMNIGNPDEFTVRQLAELVLELTGSQVQARHASRCRRTTPRCASPTSRARGRCSAGSRRSPLREGIARTIEYFRGLQATSGIGSRTMQSIGPGTAVRRPARCFAGGFGCPTVGSVASRARLSFLIRLRTARCTVAPDRDVTVDWHSTRHGHLDIAELAVGPRWR